MHRGFLNELGVIWSRDSGHDGWNTWQVCFLTVGPLLYGLLETHLKFMASYSLPPLSDGGWTVLMGQELFFLNEFYFTLTFKKKRNLLLIYLATLGTSSMAQQVKNLPAMQETQKMWVQSLGWEDPREEGMPTHSSILAWRIPWTEEPGGTQFMGSQRVRHD